MKKGKILSAVLSAAMLVSLIPAAGVSAANAPQYQTTAREMEKLNRGLIAVKVSNGVYLSWRVFGDESLADTAYEIYKEGTDAPITTIQGGQANNYTDKSGTAANKYKVVKVGATEAEKAAEPWVQAEQTKGDANYTYFDVPISMPVDIPHANTTALSDYKRLAIKDKNGKNAGSGGGANDASLGDLDGDGDYEIVLKWDPNDSKDSSSGNTTGHCVFDAYEIDSNNGGYMWRIDIGNNIAAGAHYSQFMVYDLDGDGKAEIATITAPGSYSLVKNDAGEWERIYVTTVGDTETIRNADNNATTLRKGNNNGPEYYTIFDGETGRPLYTTDAIPLGPEDGSYWGDAKMNRSERYLAAVAYLDGVHPSYIPIRGMYNRTIIRAYNWDGETLSLQWEHNGDKKGTTMYGEGNHNLNIADIDNDGKDEIVYGSACLDDDGKTILGNTKMGHGDAMHTSDFNNDGKQEVFSVKEDKEGYSRAADFRVAETGNAIWSKSITSGDNGRGFMDNVCDEYAAEHPEALALGFSASTTDVYDFNGNSVGVKPSTSRPMMNFGVYWDADLGRELLDDTIMGKYTYNKSTGKVEFGRIFFANNVGYLPGTANNSTKYTPCLVADLWGDWREEIIMAVDDNTADAPKLRIITPIAPTQYRLTTLMHDSQYRTAIAWQNVGYNQPPHTSYYIGSAALATDEAGNKLNYLAPAYPFTKVKYASSVIENPVTGLSLSESNLKLEKGQTATVQAIITPENADKKTVTWTTSNAGVATVANGTITATGRGTATITATAKDTTNGTFSATCNVEVFATDVTGINMPGYDNITIMQGGTVEIPANVVPSNATVKTINWSSTNPNVATVDSEGKVTGVSSGSAIIRAVTADGGFMGEKIVSVAGNVTDKTGTEKFTATGEGSGTTISTTEKSVTITQKEAAGGMSAQKSFEVFSDNKATLSFVLSTGGQKINNGGWGWTGHEYSLGFKLLGENDENILTVSQAFTSGAQATKYTAGTDEAKNISGDWKEVSSGSNSPLGRSSARWYMTLDFDYNNDTLTASIKNDPDDSGEESIYEKSVSLNGAKFKTLQVYTTKDGDGTITVSPSLANVTYTQSVPTDGVGSKLYDKATIDANKWTDADVSEWTAEGGTPAVTADGFGFSVNKPGASYSTSKTFTLEQDALVTYDADWHYLNLTGREGNTEYLQLGPVRIAAGNGGGSQDTEFTGQYFTKVSLDGGTTWCDFDNDGKADNISAGSNAVLDKNVSLVIDTKTNTIKSLSFGGTVIAGCTNKVLEGTPDYTKVSLGFDRGGSTNEVDYVNTIKNLTVLQFVEGAEQPSTPAPDVTDPPTVTDSPDVTAPPTVTDSPDVTTPPTEAGGSIEITGVDGNEVNVSYSTAEAHDSVVVIGALYDGGTLVEVKAKKIDKPAAKTEIPDAIEFTNNAADYTAKAFLWENTEGVKPICEAAEATPAPTPVPSSTENP